MAEGNALSAIKNAIDSLEDEVRDLRGTLQGDVFRPGMQTRLEANERELTALRDILRGLEAQEKRRKEEEAERQVRANRTLTAVYSVLTAVVGGILLQVVLSYLGGI